MGSLREQIKHYRLYFRRVQMSYSSHTVNEKGEVMCANCRRKFSLAQVDSCGYCGRFICKKCVTKKNGLPICRSCKK